MEPKPGFGKEIEPFTNTLVLGGSGLVGSRYVELCSTHPEQIIVPSRAQLDITNREQVGHFVERYKPAVLINFVAYTNVSEAENQRDDRTGSCWQTNVEGARNLVSAIDPHTFYIQLSTDMVFPGNAGNPGPYTEIHPPETDSGNLTWYGYTKAEGERVVTGALGNRAAIARIIYPVRASYSQKLDYLRKPLAAYDAGKTLTLFSDQQINVTYIDEACLALEKIARLRSGGVYHIATRDMTTPQEIVAYLIEKARGVKGAVGRSSLTDFLKTSPSPNRYPQYGGLKVATTEEILGMGFSTWREVVDKLSQSLKHP